MVGIPIATLCRRATGWRSSSARLPHGPTTHFTHGALWEKVELNLYSSKGPTGRGNKAGRRPAQLILTWAYNQNIGTKVFHKL